ncbi:MAG: LamG domain-containing protein [Cyanobacteria bacterium CRU_2_1]|nr:LamG domain-containing protein [Cyanobacteria bacterium CRU_2_1]
MPPIPQQAMTQVQVKGSFWTAIVEVIELTDPRRNWAFRNLFLDTTLRSKLGRDRLYLPGTLLLLAFVKRVEINPRAQFSYVWQRDPQVKVPKPATPAQIQVAIANGSLSLLLVQADPEAWSGNFPSGNQAFFPELTCLVGEIGLDGLTQEQNNARARLYTDLQLGRVTNPLQGREGAAHLLSEISVHGSGVSIYGQLQLPWEGTAIAAPFQVAKELPEVGGARRFRLTLERNRLTSTEQKTWTTAWNRFSRYINPRNPLNGLLEPPDAPVPNWVTFEVTNPTIVPNLYWQIAPWGTLPALHFASDDMALLFSDQPPYDQDNPPTSLGRLIPGEVRVDRVEGQLRVVARVGSGAGSGAASETIAYTGQAVEGSWQESFTLTNLTVAYSSIDTPRFLRERQQIPTPEWSRETGTVEPAVLWGFMPLENGWAQLPVPNLTEQIYLDSGIAGTLNSSTPMSVNTLQGAVSLGNDRPEFLADYPFEQPWNFILTNLKTLEGTWTLAPVTGNPPGQPIEFQLIRTTLTIQQPEVTLNGLFWLSTGKPRIEDALPDLDNWITGLRSLSLRTLKPDDLFPSLVVFTLTNFTLSARSAAPANPPKAVSALLGAWEFSYGVNPAILDQLVDRGVLPQTTFSRYLPWVWHHHPALPMVQALPLTQSQSPPNYPSASRQLVPFELQVTTVEDGKPGLPDDWRFGVSGNGAASWLQLIESTLSVPALEWQTQADLPLVALSLPGVVLNPNAIVSNTAVNPSLNLLTTLPQEYRFDLPYTDEINALAQLPSDPPDPEEVSPLPTSEPPEPPKPLTRETFADFWQQLSTLASLASADAVNAFTITANRQNEQLTIASLIEPFNWSVQPTIDLTAYPGSLTLENAGSVTNAIISESPITLAEVAALAGISGQFQPQTNGDEPPYIITAGSMAAHQENGGFRDQRGLVRSASLITEQLLRTPVTFHRNEGTIERYELTSALTALTVQAGRDQWQFWVRDLPVNRQTRRFTRQEVISAKAEDINDPEALSREHNFLTGYEWRLANANPNESNGTRAPFVPLFHLHFYPLTLETVEVENNHIKAIEIIGRLQLPLAGAKELPDLSNAVRVTFTASSPNGGSLVFSSITLVSEIGEWGLALQFGEVGNAPNLTWTGIRLQTSGDGSPAIELNAVRLNFFLFDTLWSLPIETLRFPQTFPTNELKVRSTYTFLPPGSPTPIAPETAELELDLAAFNHHASLLLDIQLGKNRDRVAFKAKVRFPLVQSDSENKQPVVWESAALFNDLVVTLTDATIVFTPNALQFQWQNYTPERPEYNLQLLPGMHLSDAKQAPGFATLTFEPTPSGDFPTLDLKTAFVETLLFCQWGLFLQTPSDVQLSAGKELYSQIFDSSAGDLVFGYTTQRQPQDSTWQESLLLNGFLEVKNLISWAKAIGVTTEGDSTFLALPPIPPPIQTDSEFFRPLSHIRHTIRILFNQHQIPSALLTIGQQELLFQFADNQAWQFLAVLEHQLIDIISGADGLIQELQNDRRWTVTQEVRLVTPTHFKRFLSESVNVNTIDPVNGISSIGNANDGYLASELRSLLSEGATAPLNQLLATTLLVEASTPHWINQDPVSAVSATTLQFLPNGSQLGILSNPQDYAPSDPRSPQWLLLTLPFLGRLQNDADEAILTSQNPLQVDPVFLLATRTLADSTLALIFASWADGDAIDLSISGFDTAAGRTWARLDPLSLEESWFRLQNPLPEAQPNGIQSVMAALPDTPARLSRSTALRHAFDPARPNYPPKLITPSPSDDRLPPEPALDASLIWRYNSLLAMQGVSAGGGNLVALYTFEQDPSNPAIVRDVSGVREPLNLTITNTSAIRWNPGGGLVVNSPTLIRSNTKAEKVIELCRKTHEITIEAWIKPAIADQRGPARIVTLSSDTNNRNFTLGHDRTSGQDGNGYIVRLRTTSTSLNGEITPTRPIVASPNRTATPDLTHVVFTRDRSGTAKIYVRRINSDRFEQVTASVAGEFSNWAENFELALANEVESNRPNNARPWLGEYQLVGIYDRALSETEIQQLFNLGPRRQARRFSRLPYSWQMAGLQLFSSTLLTNQSQLRRFTATTLIPALLKVENDRNELPLSFTVSPYLGLEFQPAPPETDLRLVSTELLCLDRVSGALLPVASRFWEDVGELRLRDLFGSRSARLELAPDSPIAFWARETHLRLAPNSPIAILRFRSINENTNPESITEARLTTTYSFAIVPDLQLTSRLAQRVFRLRSTITQLRFREGQFGGNQLPETIHPFEIAPPQVTGVQPIYLTDRPAVANTTDPQPVWAWGLSTLRFNVQYTQAKQAVIGNLAIAPANGSNSAETNDFALWWQAPQYQVQFRSALRSDLPTAGLPPTFRANVIKSLLPVLPNPPVPPIQATSQFDLQKPTIEQWQPVLPGAVRYLMIGDRPGAMFAIRHQLVRQSGINPQSNQPTIGSVMVSGSIPIQHRMPRPVPLPDNRDRNKALQTWASYFQPNQTLLATSAPADEAFFGDCGTPPNRRLAQRLQLILQRPLNGAIPSQWSGELTFDINTETAIKDWTIHLEIIEDGQLFTFINPDNLLQEGLNPFQFKLPEERLQVLQDLLARKAVGDIVNVRAIVKPAATTDNFSQTLLFPLRIIDPTALPLPLRPSFIHFEDPEYNRQLISSAAHAEGIVSIQSIETVITHTVKLASDRQEYNSDSTISLRYDWDDNRQGITATLQLDRLSSTGTITSLILSKSEIKSGQLEQIALSGIRTVQSDNPVEFVQGDTLQFTLTVAAKEIVLNVKIVQTPVIPATQAAYALLRRRSGAEDLVECVRFAWSPQATRIELICADDLLTEVVRRRAVFQWTDSVRPETLDRYAIQKITQTGSTHFPNLANS